MTNPAAAIKTLVTYVICVLLAVIVGYLVTNQVDYPTVGIFGIIGILILSPIFIKWHYPILVLFVTSPMNGFFLLGRPPLWQVMVMLSFGIAIIDRTINSEKRFISPRVMVWPLLYTAAMVYVTAYLTGGIGLKALGGGTDGGVGGGKKYIELFLGIITFFAMTSRAIPKDKRNLYIGLFFLGAFPSFVGDLFPVLPSPLNSINLLIPPTSMVTGDQISWASRLSGLGATAGVVSAYLLAKYGLRGLFLGQRPLQLVLYLMTLYVSMMGGFRITLITNGALLTILFFMEGLHRTRLLMVFILIGTVVGSLLVGFSRHLPYSVQRTLSIFPLDLDPSVRMDAEGSAQWRYDMWHDLWPKVPQYLLLGKGYALHVEDFSMMGGGQFADTAGAQMDKSNIALAVAGDYHSGPLSTLIPFGIWGGISMIWLLAASVFVSYRNYKYSDPDIKPVNTYIFATTAWHVVGFIFVFGAYSDDIFGLCRLIGFSVALNAGVRAAKPRVQYVPPPAVRHRNPHQPQPLPA